MVFEFDRMQSSDSMGQHSVADTMTPRSSFCLEQSCLKVVDHLDMESSARRKPPASLRIYAFPLPFQKGARQACTPSEKPKHEQ